MPTPRNRPDPRDDRGRWYDDLVTLIIKSVTAVIEAWLNNGGGF